MMVTTYSRLEVCTLSAFRDNVRYELVTVARHPQDAYDILGVLQEAFRDKVHSAKDGDVKSSQYVAGLHEAWAFVANLRADVAREYGYKEGEEDAVVRGR